MIEHLLGPSMNAPVADLESDPTRPRVLLVVDQFPKNLGGGERMLLKLAALLPKYGFCVSILTFFVHPECTSLNALSCPIYVLPLRRTYDWRAVRAAFSFRHFLKKQRIQLVQTFFESSDIWAGFVVKTMSRAKLVWSRRDMGILRGRKHETAYRLMARMPDAVFAVSEQVRQHCIDVDGIDSSRVTTIYNGLDLTEWNRRTAPLMGPGKILVTTVGNIRRVKGHDLLVRAAAILAPRFPELTFSIAGAVLDPDYFQELEEMIRGLGLSGIFQFPGCVVDVQEHLAGADIFVLPSRSEGFSNAIVEAMAVGLPIVASDVGGNAEAVQNGVNGVIVPAEDPGALANAIAEMLVEPARARAFGESGRAIAGKRFSTDAMMAQVVSAYRRLLDGQNRLS